MKRNLTHSLLCSLATIAALSVGGTALANDCPFSYGGEGANLVPIKNSEIEMVDEKIVIKKNNGKWHVKVVFHFKNESATKQTLTVGFPFPYDKSEGYCRDNEDVWGVSFVSNFKSTVRGSAVSVKKIQLVPRDMTEEDTKKSLFGGEYSHAFVWDITFNPGETVEIVNTYDTDSSQHIEGHEEISYVLKTGRFWKSGKIGRTQIELYFDKNIQLCSDVKQVLFTDSMGMLPCMSYSEFKYPYKRVDDKDGFHLVWDLKDFTPEEDLQIQYTDNTSPLELEFKDHDLCYPNDLACWKEKSCSDLGMISEGLELVSKNKWKEAKLPEPMYSQYWYQALSENKVSQPTDDMLRMISMTKKAILHARQLKHCK